MTGSVELLAGDEYVVYVTPNMVGGGFQVTPPFLLINGVPASSVAYDDDAAYFTFTAPPGTSSGDPIEVIASEFFPVAAGTVFVP